MEEKFLKFAKTNTKVRQRAEETCDDGERAEGKRKTDFPTLVSQKTAGAIRGNSQRQRQQRERERKGKDQGRRER